MPGSMPYSLEKGPYLSVIEDFVNGDRGRALETLARLRNGDDIDQLDTFDSQPLDTGPYTEVSSAITSSGTGSATRRTRRELAAAVAVRRSGVAHHGVLAGVARRLRRRPAPHADPRARGEPRDPAHARRLR